MSDAVIAMIVFKFAIDKDIFLSRTRVCPDTINHEPAVLFKDDEAVTRVVIDFNTLRCTATRTCLSINGGIIIDGGIVSPSIGDVIAVVVLGKSNCAARPLFARRIGEFRCQLAIRPGI